MVQISYNTVTKSNKHTVCCFYCAFGAKPTVKEVNDLKRKLFALLLSGLAIILLMGAGVDTVALAAEAVTSSTRTEEPAAPAEKPADDIETDSSVTDVPAVELDRILLLDGQPVPKTVKRTTIANATYVSLKVMSQQMDTTAQVSWDNVSSKATVTAQGLELTARAGDVYVIANGRYLYMPQGVQMVDDQMMVSLDVLAKAFGATTGWDGESGTFLVTRGEAPIESADVFYKEDDLFWLSRVIYAESGNQSLEGMMAVGNVVLNRTNHPTWPDSIYGVISQRNQFSTFKGGRLANRTPNAGSVIAAKLVLDGGVAEGAERAYFFDTYLRSSWAARNKQCVAEIGGHRFYG